MTMDLRIPEAGDGNTKYLAIVAVIAILCATYIFLDRGSGRGLETLGILGEDVKEGYIEKIKVEQTTTPMSEHP